jgi:hypothetical protein
MTNLEETFLNDNIETGRFILSIGSKGSGKTYRLLQYLKFALYNNIYERYHLILPMYSSEQNDSYGFLQTQQNCYIYNGYSEKVSILVDKDRLKYRTLFIIDDASSELVKKMDNTFLKLITTTRHGKGVTVWACVHSCKRILSPAVRQNIDWLFTYKIPNRKLLNDLYDEYFGMQFDSFKLFMQIYTEVMKEKYNSVLCSLHVTDIDTYTNDWVILKQYDTVELEPQKAIKKPIQKPVENPPHKHTNLHSMFSNMFKKRF